MILALFWKTMINPKTFPLLINIPSKLSLSLTIKLKMQWISFIVLALTAPNVYAIMRFSCSELVTERLDP
jgi:hypothetical protein